MKKAIKEIWICFNAGRRKDRRNFFFNVVLVILAYFVLHWTLIAIFAAFLAGMQFAVTTLGGAMELDDNGG